MFRVIARNYSEEFARWTDALNKAKSLQPNCKSLLEDIKIFDGKELIWVYSRSHTYPQYIGAGTYQRLATLFVYEALQEQQEKQELASDPRQS